MTDKRMKEVLLFWLGEVGPKGWFVSDPKVDAACDQRFGALVESALAGSLRDWETTAEGALALLILLDQFPRNLYRGEAKAFAGDARALDVAEQSLAAGFDLDTALPERCFFYMPFEHSERLADQDFSVKMFRERTREAEDWENWVRHAEQHRDLIRRFGRFPHRNAALGRPSTEEEQRHLAEGGYQPGAAPK